MNKRDEHLNIERSFIDLKRTRYNKGNQKRNHNSQRIECVLVTNSVVLKTIFAPTMLAIQGLMANSPPGNRTQELTIC